MFQAILKRFNHVRLSVRLSVEPSVRLSVCPSVRLSTPVGLCLYGRYLGYPSMDSFLLLHMERPYIGAVRRGVIFRFSPKLKKWQIFKKRWFFRLCHKWEWVCTEDISVTLQRIRVSSRIWKDHILELCDEGLFFDFLQNWKNAKSVKNGGFLTLPWMKMSLYERYLCNPSTDSCFLSHI